MTAVTVLVPWRPDSLERQAAWEYLRRRWETTHPAWQVLEAHHLAGPWSKGAAVAAALPEVSDGIVVLADADCWCGGTAAAVEAVTTGRARWAVPHRLVRRLSRHATTAVLDGAPLNAAPQAEPAYLGHAGGGITVLPRQLLGDIPLDPRFHGWGQEDDAWAHALTTLAGKPWRGVDDLHHLWHPPQPRRNRIRGSDTSWRLYLRYRHAARNPDTMRTLLDEVRRGATIT